MTFSELLLSRLFNKLAGLTTLNVDVDDKMARIEAHASQGKRKCEVRSCEQLANQCSIPACSRH